VHVDTGDAYRRLAAERERVPAPTRARAGSASLRALEAVQRADYPAAVAAAVNDFEPLIAALYPPVANALEALRAAGAPYAMLSGSGGAVFALCPGENEARALEARVVLPAGARLYVVPLALAAGWRAPNAA
jgi:4-diphosphocytidyl-2-C-methyl-D-erythritol kinase